MKVVRNLFVDFVFLWLLLFDGQISSLLSFIFPNSMRIISHFLFLGFLWLSIRYNKWHAVALAFLLGFIYDLYFINFLGLDVFLFPIIMLIYVYFNEILLKNIWSYWLSCLLTIFFFEVLSFCFASFLGLTILDFSYFVVFALFPTLLINLLFYTLIYPIFRKIFI